MGTLVRKMEQNTKTVGLVMCSVYTDRCHMLKNAFVCESKRTYIMVGLKSDVFKLSCDVLPADMEMPFNYVEEDSNLNLIQVP